MRHERHFAARDRSFEEIRFWLPAMLTATQSDWTQGFLASVLTQSKRPNWRPSEKQMGILRRITSDWFDGRIDRRDDFEVLE